jgi:hypothetical protein
LLQIKSDVIICISYISEKACMGEEPTRRDWFDWRLPFYGAVGAVILFVPIIVDGTHIIGTLYLFVAAPIISFILLAVVVRKKGRRRIGLVDIGGLLGCFMGIVHEFS